MPLKVDFDQMHQLFVHLIFKLFQLVFKDVQIPFSLMAGYLLAVPLILHLR